MKWIKIIFLIILSLNASKIELNFQNLDLNDFIKMVAKITDKNILIPETLRGKVNFISVKPVNEKELYSILLNILRSKGYTIIEDNGYLKVVRLSEAKRNAPPLFNKNNFYQIQTSIIYLKNISARDAYSQTNYLLSRYGKMVINKEKNLLIITDFPSNIEVIESILKRIDTQNQKAVKIFKIKNADIDKLYEKITQIISMIFPRNIYNYKILKDNSISSIIAIGNKEVINKLSTLIPQFDIKPQTISKTTRIITLKNSDAKNIYNIIKQIASQKYKKNPPSITIDKQTNSIIILGSNDQIETLISIIKALDIPKEQVYVKAKILEISNLKASQLGNRFGILGGIGSSSGLYTLSANLGGPPIAFDVKSLGLSIPTIKQGLALGVTMDLLERFGAAKKLSEPSILCINNTPSSIYVGKTISVLTGKTTSTSTSESYTREDIGLTLKVTPRIDSDNKVALNVQATIEDLLPGSPSATLPITSKRTINTNSIVVNGQTIIIGGLVRDNKDITIQKVPLLGDIPIIGALFRHKETNDDKTTLVILLTPYIVKKADDLEKLKETLAKLSGLEKQFLQKLLKKYKQKNKKTIKNNNQWDILNENNY